MTSPSDLPTHLEAVRAAVLDGLADEPLVTPTELAGLREQLVERLRPIAQELAPSSEIHLDRHSLPRAVRCPASAESDFPGWTAPFAARSLGLPAVAWMQRTGEADISAAVQASVAEVIGEGKGLGSWLVELSPEELATVTTRACSWAARAWVSIPWPSFDMIQFSFGSIWHRPLGGGTSIILRGRPDGAVMVRGSRARERVLVSLGLPEPLVIGLDALVVAFDVRRAPLRVVMVQASSGQIRAVEVDLSLLERAVDDVVKAAQGLSPEPGDRQRLPGGHCWFCDQLPDCEPGTIWTASQQRRVGGIPVAIRGEFLIAPAAVPSSSHRNTGPVPVAGPGHVDDQRNVTGL